MEVSTAWTAWVRSTEGEVLAAISGAGCKIEFAGVADMGLRWDYGSRDDVRGDGRRSLLGRSNVAADVAAGWGDSESHAGIAAGFRRQ